MNLTVHTAKALNGVVDAPSSKSYTIRALLASCLADCEVIVDKPLFSGDTRSCMEVCRGLGADVSEHEEYVLVKGTSGKPDAYKTLDCVNSGTTLRLATAIASLSESSIQLTGDDSLRSRPIQPLLDALKQLKVNTASREGRPPVFVKGPLRGGECHMPGDVSSQYISAMLMACPCARDNTQLKITTELKSRPYIDLTLEVLGHFGVYVDHEGYHNYTIPGGQSYHSKAYTVEGDYSSAAFLLAAGALTQGDVEVGNLHVDSLQADRKIISILMDMGAKIDVRGDIVDVMGDGHLTGCEMDLGDSPDLLPICSVLGALAEGETKIVNCEHARYKECDRIAAMASELTKMGANVKENRDGLTLKKSRLHGALVDGWRDHRIIMSLTVAGLRATGATSITDAQYVNITYPDFMSHMSALEAHVNMD